MVTRVTGAYADIYAWDNLYAAYRLAARGKRGRPAAAAFEYRLEDNLVRLEDELAAETYRPGPYASFIIHEPKRRLISAAPFRDRVVHHALCQVIEPAFERELHRSLLRQPGRQGHASRLARARRGPGAIAYVLQCDVVQFFPSIDHSILARTLNRRSWPDGGIRRLIAADPGQRRRRAERAVRHGLLSRRRSVRREPAARAADRQPDQPVLGQLLSEPLRPLRDP